MSWPEGVPAKAELRDRLRSAYPWFFGPDLGPAAVEAGSCDRCGAEPRLVLTCGPGGWPFLGRRCVAAVGAEAWCDGHAAEAGQALEWLAALPDDADDLAWLWWLSTGEVRPVALPPGMPRLGSSGQLALAELPSRSPAGSGDPVQMGLARLRRLQTRPERD